MSRLTFENRRDQLFFFISVEIFKIKIFQSRLWRVKIFVEIVEAHRVCWDASRFLRFVEMQSRFVETLSRFVKKSQHCRGLLSLKMMKSLDGLRNLDEKIQKSTHFSIEIETNCQELRQTVKKRLNFQISMKFSIEIFWSGRWCRDKIEISRSSRLT